MSCGMASRDATGIVLLGGAAASLERFADARAGGSPIRPRDDDGWYREIVEELADARNYLVWWIQKTTPGYLAGDGDAAEQYARAMRALVAVLHAWAALCGP